MQELPVVLKPSSVVRFFARWLVLPPIIIWLVWVSRRIVAQPDMVLQVSLQDWGGTVFMLLLLGCALRMASFRVVLDADAIETRSLFGRKRLHLSQIRCQCHYVASAVSIVNLYANNKPLRLFRADMRVPVGLFSLNAGEKILQFMEPIPVSDHCAYTR